MGVQLRRLGPNSQIKTLQYSSNGYHKWLAGRGSHCDIMTRSKYASRKHFSIIYKEKHFYVCDHGSANGTFLNNQKIEPQREYPLTLKSLISVGVLPIYKDESDCVVFIFELSEEEEKKDPEDDAYEKGFEYNQENSPIGSNFSAQTKQSSVDNVNQLCGTVTEKQNSEVFNRSTDCGKEVTTVFQVKTEKVDTSEEVNVTHPTKLSYDIQASNEEQGLHSHQNINNTECIENNDNICDSYVESMDCEMKGSEVDLFEPEALVDDEIVNAFEVPTQKDEVVSGNTHLSYSMTEELIEISDSDEETAKATKIKSEEDSNYVPKLKIEDEDEFDDEVIFLDSIVKSKENYPGTSEIKIEDEDFTETDIKWMGKLFKTKEECDSFIQSQRETSENISEANDGGDDDGWVTLVSNCAEEIGQILLSEIDAVRVESGIAENDEIKQNTEKHLEEQHVTKSIENKIKSEPITNEHSRVIGLLTLSPEFTGLEPSTNQGLSFNEVKVNKDFLYKKSRKIQLRDPFDDCTDEDALKPLKKKTKLDFTVNKKDSEVAQESQQNRIVKLINIYGPATSKRGSKKKRKRKKKMINLNLPASEIEKIKDQRKLKLRELSMRHNVQQDKKETPPKVVAPLKIKITRKNRSQFLCEEIRESKETESNICVAGSKLTSKDNETNKLTVSSDESNANRPGEENLLFGSSTMLSISGLPDKAERFTTGSRDDIPECNENLPPEKEIADNVRCAEECMTVVAPPTRVLKSCLKKFGLTFMKRRPMVSKKFVRFGSTQSIRYYETENRITRKISSLPLKAVEIQTFPEDTLGFKSVLYSVCNWNTIWLEECRNAPPRELPPSFRNDKLRNVQKKFSNHNEYSKAFIPLLLLELWHTVSEQWKATYTWSRLTANFISYSDYTSESSEYLGLIHCECLLKCINASSNIREGDLVLIQLSKTPSKNYFSQSNNKKLAYRIFGYVEKKTINTISPTDVHFNASQKCNDEVFQIVKFEIIVKGRTELRTYSGNTLHITRVYHIAPQLMLCQAVCFLYKSPLCHVVLSPNRPDMSLSTVLKKEDIIFCGPLDNRQEELVLKLVSSCINRDINVVEIQGGPGTGKTHVMVAFILQLLFTKQWKDSHPPKILYCSHSNIVADEFALKLKSYRKTLSHNSRYKLVRFGNLNSIRPAVRDISSHQLALQNEYNATITRKLKVLDEKINALAADLGASDKLDNNDIQEKSTKLHEYVRHREAIKNSRPSSSFGHTPSLVAENAILENADVICTTCTKSGSAKMIRAFQNIKSKAPKQKIICIIDEAMQSKEPETIVPLQLGVTHLILIGDPQQLRSPVRSEMAQSYGINQSLFWRILSIFEKMRNNSPVFTLKNQYRMSPGVSSILNGIFYNNSMTDCYQTKTPFQIEEYMVLIDNEVSVASGTECDVRLQNLVEKTIIEITNIMKHGDENYSIGIISCRLDQAKSLRTILNQRCNENLMSKVEVNSIENVQGREYDIVLFLFDVNMQCAFRANVAMTRAKSSLIIMTSHPCYKSNKLLWKLADKAAGRGAFFYVSCDMEGELIKKMITKFNG